MAKSNAADRATKRAQRQRVAQFKQGAVIYRAGEDGVAWRVTEGSIRLDRVAAEGSMFASLAVAGDVIGVETLLFGTYAFEAHALSDCALQAWSEGSGAASGDSLLQTLAAVERRAADVIALRAGQAAERVKRLIILLTRDVRPDASTAYIALPPLRDMAEITGLTAETVSRVISGLRRDGVLAREGWRHASLERARLLSDAQG